MAITTPTHTGTSPWTVAIHSPVGSETWQREALHAALGDVTFFVNEATKRGTAVLVTVRDKRGVLVSRSWSPAYDIFPGVH